MTHPVQLHHSHPCLQGLTVLAVMTAETGPHLSLKPSAPHKMKWHVCHKPSSLALVGDVCQTQRRDEHIQAQMYTEADTTAGKKKKGRKKTWLVNKYF